MDGWHPIADLEHPAEGLAVSELRALDTLWREKRQELEELDAMRDFRKKLSRTWAIETGVIEDVYDLDRGTTELLIERGLHENLIDRSATDQDPGLVIQIIRDQHDAIDGLFDFIKRERALSTSYVKELHAAITRHQTTSDAVDSLGRRVKVALLHGEWKRLPNNPTRDDGTTHVYCPPEQVSSEMDRLLELHAAHQLADVPPEVEAAFLHHRFTQIHPFQDGNGRVARVLASLVLLRAGWFPLTIDRERKGDYIETLEAADLGNLKYLSEMIAHLQRKELVTALSIGDQTKREQEGVDQVIRAVREKVLGTAATGAPQELAAARATADRLVKRGHARIEALKQQLQREVIDYAPSLKAYTDAWPAGSERARWHGRTVVGNARRLGYFANRDTYAAWFRLELTADDEQDEVIVAFHGIGTTFRGLIAVTAFWQYATQEDGSWQRTEDRLLDEELFQVNSREDPAVAEERFDAWLEHVLTAGLAIWQRRLSAPS
ncbi:MAG: Fic family protein [Solirubrobacteraceae bacterium MAG38_C4-C5]|nr:Fic family protein [Candidatus Siliceabacter maunaloa]